MRSESACLLKSVAINSLGSGLDYLIVLSLVTGLGVATPIGTISGVMAGASFNFYMNRRLAFTTACSEAVSGQVIRFITSTLVLAVLHAIIIWTLRDRLGFPLVPVKMVADFSLFATTQPFLFKYYVFADPAASWALSHFKKA